MKRIIDRRARWLALPAWEAAAITAVAALLSAGALTALEGGATHVNHLVVREIRVAKPPAGSPAPTTPSAAHAGITRPKRRAVPAGPRVVGIGTVLLHLVDTHRTITAPSGAELPRTFDTVVRYPLLAGTAGSATGRGPFPLVVFGHGFAVTPQPYSLLLDAWARAGYVVAAPIFPLENAGAPGGPNEKDLVNQPGDMSLVITRVLAAARADNGVLSGLVDPANIVVTGQSDGGDTALATAFDPTVRDPRVGAAMILSGAEDPFAAPFAMPPDGPPLLAVQGTADTINPQNLTYQFFRQAPPPKFLLKLLGAGHQPPYTETGPELSDVERMTLAFLARYAKGDDRPLQRLIAQGSAGPGSALTAVP